MDRRGWSLLASGALTLALVASACGGAAAPTATPARAPAAAATATTAPPGAPATPTRAAPVGLGTPTPTRAAVPTVAPVSGGPVGKMTMAAVADVTNLDVHVATAGGLQYFYTVSDVNAFLLVQQRAGRSDPWLAESWAWDDKGLKVRWVIRKGARFHDGKPVTADDAKFTAEKIKAPYSARGVNSGVGRWIKDVQVIDDRTFVMTAPEVLATLYATYGGIAIQPRHDPYEVMQKKPIGAGPYRVADWRPFESMTLEASPYFWDADKVQVKTIVRLVVPEPESRLAMLKSGQVDLMDEVQPRQAEELAKDKRFRVKVTDAGNIASIVFATDTPVIPGTDIPNPFLDARVRRAFTMAVDRKAIFDGIALGKYGTYVPGPWPRHGYGANTMEDKITPYKYDPQAARKLLEEAQFPFDREWGVWYYRTSAGFAEATEVAVAQWNAIGIKARGRLTEVGALMSYWQEKPSRTYPIQMIRSLTVDEPPGYIVATENVPEGTLSQIGDPKLDEWTIKRRTAFEPAERQKLYEEVYVYEHEQAITFPLLGGVLIHALNQRVDWDPIPGQMFATHLWKARWLPGAP
ncbi:MAG: ABC transporter substrate-binding protein [Chloroflexi bacterium]|nr:ABC transporter substrate-binding protein [Chloroflexota bacterium]